MTLSSGRLDGDRDRRLLAAPVYDDGMYTDALSFLEDERDAWRPYEALSLLTDEQLEAPVEAAHGWSGRDLMGHLVFWQEQLLAMAQELAINDASPTRERVEAAWAADPEGVNAAALADWRALSTAEVRRRFATAPGELRGYLTVVPEARWLKHPQRLASFLGGSTEHYQEHVADLQTFLSAAAADPDRS
jgi:hypothetical protein